MNAEDETRVALKQARDEIARLWRAINAMQVEIGKRADACRELKNIGNARPKAQAYEHAERIIVEELDALRDFADPMRQPGVLSMCESRR